MTDPEDLARRYLTLWAEYLAALWVEIGAAGPPEPRHVAEPASAAASAPAEDGAGASSGEAGPAPGAAPAAGAPRRYDDIVAELARRVAALEDRVAGIERAG